MSNIEIEVLSPWDIVLAKGGKKGWFHKHAWQEVASGESKMKVEMPGATFTYGSGPKQQAYSYVKFRASMMKCEKCGELKNSVMPSVSFVGGPDDE